MLVLVEKEEILQWRKNRLEGFGSSKQVCLLPFPLVWRSVRLHIFRALEKKIVFFSVKIYNMYNNVERSNFHLFTAYLE